MVSVSRHYRTNDAPYSFDGFAKTGVYRMIYLAMVFTLENSKPKGEEVRSRARDARCIDR